MTVLDFLRLTRKNWVVLLVGVIAGVLVMFGYTLLQPRVYTASSAGYVVAGGSAGFMDAMSGTEAAATKARSFIPLITSGAVFDQIASDPTLDLGGESLSGRLSASVAEGSTLLEVSATASSPEAAAALADGALEAVAAVVEHIESEVGAESSSILVVPLENAVVPTQPVSPDLRVNLLLGGVIGLVAAYLFVFLRKAADVRVRTAADLSTAAGGAGTLGRIPKSEQLAGKNRAVADVDAHAAEAFRRLRTNLRFSSVDGEVHSVVVTSANVGEGKSTVSVMLARVLARSGQPTVLIDADLRRPSVAGLAGVDGSIGLSEVLSGQVRFEDVLRTTDTPGLLVLPAGHVPPNPSEMLGSQAMRSLVATLSDRHFVVIDAPPVLPVTDAVLLSMVADGTILLATVGKTRKEDVVLARQMLDQVHSRLLGTVLNKVSGRDAGEGHEYKRNSKYYMPSAAAERSSDGATLPTPVTWEPTGESSAEAAGSRRSARRGA
ncbi:polysaccharide biosynthesis tyrosine autokinase [Microbacterium allomyrinae]|jgi:succinoglycan biosynthesis transport protein ExoP|uniref:Polysaccharide biosynthesis tyrosine autokinase n=1 Tax=Microbacterium allomyrinae TaxID=2830666 RepID=A0A9X1LS34_9MICO|nr:polysaccharide biosynthesis tyrosine autokinase [Microbacterium allomyrinae]MCC2030738.1 polysaccharide biosynthesis tyrosine autokinase [Microbacterium allomyrinae]